MPYTWTVEQGEFLMSDITLYVVAALVFVACVTSIVIEKLVASGKAPKPVESLYNAVNMFFLRATYNIGSYVYRISYNRRLRRSKSNLQNQKLSPAFARVKPVTTWSLSSEDERSLLLHEVEFTLGIDLVFSDENTIQLSNRDFKRLHEYCTFTREKAATPEKLFGSYGLVLMVAKR
jgi:hypothetical protein